MTSRWRITNKAAFPWKTFAVCEIGKVITGFTPPTKERERFFGGDIPFYKPTDLDAGYQVIESRETLTQAGAASGRVVPAGSTLVTCIGATIDKTGLARRDCCTNQQINAIVPDRLKVVPEWLYWMVVSPDFRGSILENSSATTLPIINKGRFERLALPVPGLDEQHEIVRRIERAFSCIDAVAVQAERSFELLERLDRTILEKAFRGELVSQEPTKQRAVRRGEHVAA
jgi:type I restriction enzyme, S subunit